MAQTEGFASKPPARTFLDTCTLQVIVNQTEFISDGGRVSHPEKVRKRPNGMKNLLALRKIMRLGRRKNMGFVVSENSLEEVEAKKDHFFWAYAHEWFHYSRDTVYDPEEVPTPHAQRLREWLDENQFEYLGEGDRALLKDAIALGCDGFLTVEENLPKQRDHLNKELGIHVLRPFEYWELG